MDHPDLDISTWTLVALTLGLTLGSYLLLTLLRDSSQWILWGALMALVAVTAAVVVVLRGRASDG